MALTPDSTDAEARLTATIGRALAAYRALGALGETVADEWQYVNDLVTVYSADLESLRAAGPDRVLPSSAVHAVEVAIEEIALIADPHRAIDWLSTFPQIVRLVVAPPPVAPSPPTSSGG
jgi:hypothetical protein